MGPIPQLKRLLQICSIKQRRPKVGCARVLAEGVYGDRNGFLGHRDGGIEDVWRRFSAENLRKFLAKIRREDNFQPL